MNSIRWRILSAFVLIIVLAIFLSVGVGYYSIQGQLQEFVTALSSDEADRLAQKLSRGYTLAGGWQTVDITLFEAGYFYGQQLEKEGHEGGEGHEEGESAESSEGFHRDPVRIVIVDAGGNVVKDNFYQLAPGELAPPLDGQQVAITDLGSGQQVGKAYVDVNNAFLETEALDFLQGTLSTIAIGGLLTFAVALLLAAWLSRRITAPVTALTEATQAIAKHGESAMLPVTSSDELGQMSAAFNQMSGALQTQRDLRRQLINDVSHELNTPLSVIQLEAKGLGDGLQSPEEASDHIIEEVNMLRNLVHDLNWLAETDSGELRLTFETVTIERLLGSEVARWQPQAQAQQIALSLQPLPDLPNINLDTLRMSQALGNVIHNALQHTEPGGQVVVGASAEGQSVIITVTDDGVGINPADLPYVFDRFYRAGQSRDHRSGGTGLGLAIARAIVEAHNGEIAVTSEGPGQGTAVHIELPLS